MFFEFVQNNSCGYYHNNEVFCPRMVFQCDSEEEAIALAEGKGLYWNGVEQGIDCPHCGDRWQKRPQLIDLHTIRRAGYRVRQYCEIISEEDAIDEWNRKYGKYIFVEAPEWKQGHYRVYEGRIAFSDIEEYEQFMSDEYCICNGDILPAARIFYKDGSVKEIYRTKHDEE